jgi:[acyl-carrier-protein] S-malonyltransferase
MDDVPHIPRSLAVLCPGQGAQAVAMGKAWAERSPEAKAVFAAADKILGTRLGTSLSTLCFEGPADRLNQTDASQPAIFTCSYACWRGLLASWKMGEGEAPLVAAAGLSLGEYTALAVAGAITFEDGLELVTLRGRAMQDAAESVPSSMVALIGADEPQANAVCDQARGTDVLVPANFNAPGQIVISGSKAACERAVTAATAMGLRATALQVAGAFHSPIMAPAAERLSAALAKTSIRAARCPVLSNVSGVPHDAAGTPQDFAARVRAALVQQLTHPVRWAQNAAWVASHAAAGNPSAELHELAPGKTLAGLMRRIDKNAKVTAHDEP